eukprot:GILI01004535.1.p1 GENE.GILI01004535.1~~GILI01004535.1.p1  ORF type:complete len:348 (-),score=129.75 GILI01004535.1:198-1241(-)
MSASAEETIVRSGSGPNLNCRMYENKYPENDDLVMVLVKSVQEMGVYVTLLEYNNVEGMILLSELSKRRIRSVNKLVSVNRQEVGVVLRVDKEKGYIDLSKRRVEQEDLAKCENKFHKSKTVHSIMRHVAEQLNMDLEALYIQVGWPLYRKYSHAYDAFSLLIGPEPVDIFEGLEVPQSTKDLLIKQIKRRMTPQPVKIRADVEVTCFDYEGIDAIKAALKAAESCGTQDIPVQVKLVSPPQYVITAVTLEKDLGIQLVNNAVEAVKKEITARRGQFVLKHAARMIGDQEEKQLLSLMEKMEQQNREVGGDDDEDENQEGITANIDVSGLPDPEASVGGVEHSEDGN